MASEHITINYKAMRAGRKCVGFMVILGTMVSSIQASAGPHRPHFPGLFHGPGPLFDLIVVGTTHLFFKAGGFYRKGPAGYVAVAAPEGAVIPALPAGYGLRIVDNAKYYYFNGIYYVRVPGGYMVVAPPVVTAKKTGHGLATVLCIGDVSVAVDMLNVRSGPGMKYDVVALTYRGEILKIYHASEDWFYVELPSGQLGWVDRKFTGNLNRVPAG